MPERRIAELAPPVELLGEEAGDVVAGGVAKRRRVRLERLHDHLPGRVAAAPAGELGDELEGALLGAEVGQREPGVGVDDRGERDAREVVALGDHLRADEDGAVGRGEPRRALRASAPGFAAVSASSRIRSSSGTRFASSASSRCVPAPIRASSDEPHDGQASGTASE